MDCQAITEQFRHHGYRLTEARIHVTRALCQAGTYVGAYDIYNTLQELNIHVGIASIYRVLELLCSLGLVQREEFGAGGEKFRISSNSHTHQLVCSGCGQAQEFSNCALNSMAQALERTSGFKIQDHWLRFFGLCPTCQSKQA